MEGRRRETRGGDGGGVGGAEREVTVTPGSGVAGRCNC